MELLNGTLLTLDTVNEEDYGIETADLSKIGQRGNRPHILLQQTDLEGGAYSCFYTAPFRCAADAYALTQDERTRALKAWRTGWDQLRQDGLFTPGYGGRMADGVDYARRAWNSEFPEKPVRSYRGEFPNVSESSTIGEQAFYRAIFSGWMVTIGRYSSDTIVGDLLDDGIVQNDDKATGNNVYGHLTCGIAAFRPNDLKILDNYPKYERDGVKLNGLTWKNTYVLDDIRQKRTNGQVYPSSYIFLPA